jgi:hypothetical protein
LLIHVKPRMRFHAKGRLLDWGRSGWMFVYLVNRVPGQGPEQRESEKTVLYPQIIIILISYIIIKLLINENHPGRNRKQNSRGWMFKLLSEKVYSTGPCESLFKSLLFAKETLFQYQSYKPLFLHDLQIGQNILDTYAGKQPS